MNKSTALSDAAALMGSIGGMAAKGAKKRRGDSDYYRKLSALGVAARKANAKKK